MSDNANSDSTQSVKSASGEANSGVRFDAKAKKEPSSKYITGKRLSRNIVGIIVVGVGMAAIISFALVNGNKNTAVEAKAAKLKKDNEAMAQQAQQLTKSQAENFVNEQALKALADKAAKDKANQSTLDRIKAGNPNADYPPNPLLSKVDQYEQDKLRAQVYRGNEKEPAAKTLVAFEGGSSGDGVIGFGQDKVKEMQDYLHSVGDANGQDEKDRAEREAKARGQGAEMPANGVDSNDQWRASQTQINQVIDTSESLKPQIPPSKYILSEGNVMTVVLMTAIDSQLPGKISAKTTEDVYDSINGNHLLIPRNTSIIGSYNTDVRGGQDRVFIAFSRMIFPNGTSMQIGSMTGSDPQGRAGVEGNVFNGFWKQMATSFLIAGVSALAEPGDTTVNNYGGGNGMRTSSGQILVDTAKANLDRYAQYRPRITVEAGQKITIVVAKDMELDPAVVRNPVKFKQ